MSESEYNGKVVAAAQAYLHHIISYSEWELWMKKLIKEKENRK